MGPKFLLFFVFVALDGDLSIGILASQGLSSATALPGLTGQEGDFALGGRFGVDDERGTFGSFVLFRGRLEVDGMLLLY